MYGVNRRKEEEEEEERDYRKTMEKIYGDEKQGPA